MGFAPSNPMLCFLRWICAPSPPSRPAKFALTRKTGRLVGENIKISVRIISDVSVRRGTALRELVVDEKPFALTSTPLKIAANLLILSV